MNADQIIVLDEGQIAGLGTHRELMNTCEVYREIVSSSCRRKSLRRNLHERRAKTAQTSRSRWIGTARQQRNELNGPAWEESKRFQRYIQTSAELFSPSQVPPAAGAVYRDYRHGLHHHCSENSGSGYHQTIRRCPGKLPGTAKPSAGSRTRFRLYWSDPAAFIWFVPAQCDLYVCAAICPGRCCPEDGLSFAQRRR